MTLPLPHLDKLEYDALVGEARDLLPYLAPEWTDHNAHDPGITLLELLAWLSEANSYRLDRLPPASERAFLRLLDYRPRPAQVARTVLAFDGGSGPLAPGQQVSTADGRTRFQIGTPFQVVDAHIVALLTSNASGWTTLDPSSSFQPLGAQPAVGDAFYIGFNVALAPAGGRVRLFALSDDPARDEATWHALYAEHRRTRGNTPVGCLRTPCHCLHPLWQHHGARVSWQYYDGATWQSLPGLRDATRALSLSGPLRFTAPSDMQPGDVPGHDAPFFIRAQLVCGEYDCAPRWSALWLNAVLARHAADNPVRTLGPSSGQAAQHFDLSREPIVPSHTEVTLTLPDATQSRWDERATFDRSGPLARHFTIDTARGQIVFGDGRSGRVPEAGGSVSAQWQTGSGAGGNLPAHSLVALLAGPPALGVNQVVAAWGGAEAETLGAAEARAVQSLANARCPVTLQDFERLALQVPGAPLARAHAVAEFHPRLHCLPATGCVTLVVVSPCVRSHPDPTPALCRAVRCYLETRRPVTTEVHVTGPEWLTVSVKATLRTRDGANAASLRAEALRRINTFFDTLIGGPDGNGWAFGRPVFRTEVLALLDTLPGVTAVEALALVPDDGADDLCNNIALCPHGLVRSGAHVFTVSPEAPR
jgi:hypothetical protein